MLVSDFLSMAHKNTHFNFCQTQDILVTNCLCWRNELSKLVNAQKNTLASTAALLAKNDSNNTDDSAMLSQNALSPTQQTAQMPADQKLVKTKQRPEKRLKIHNAFIPCKKQCRLSAMQHSSVTCGHCLKKINC